MRLVLPCPGIEKARGYNSVNMPGSCSYLAGKQATDACPDENERAVVRMRINVVNQHIHPVLVTNVLWMWCFCEAVKRQINGGNIDFLCCDEAGDRS